MFASGEINLPCWQHVIIINLLDHCNLFNQSRHNVFADAHYSDLAVICALKAFVSDALSTCTGKLNEKLAPFTFYNQCTRNVGEWCEHNKISNINVTLKFPGDSDNLFNHECIQKSIFTLYKLFRTLQACTHMKISIISYYCCHF